jgi:predicted ATP-dependent protease
MLRHDVVEAVEKGEFHVYPVEHVDQGLEILTGLGAGERTEDGSFPSGSINALVEERLVELARKSKEFSGKGD